MANYRLTEFGHVIRTADGASIPDDAANADRAAYEAWRAAGGVPEPHVAPAAEQMFLPQDLIAQFTAADIAAVQVAIAGSSGMALLWYSLLAQRDPMRLSSERVQNGWAALVQVLGQGRMATIAAAMNITI